MLQRFRESWSIATPNTRLFLVLLTLFVIACLVAFTLVVRNWRPHAPPGSGDLAEHTTPDLSRVIRQTATKDGPVQLIGIAEKAVLDRHFSVIGGIEKISAISSLRFSGKVTFDNDVVQEVVVVKKGGDRMRTTVRSKMTQTSWVVSPGSNWRGIWVNGNLREVTEMSDEEVEGTMRYIHVVSELFLAQQKGWEMKYLGVKDFNYRMAHVFEIKLDPRHIAEFYIEPKTFLDLGRVDKVFESDGTLTITRRLHMNHFDANGFMLPGRVETYLNNELIQEFELESAQFNAGVLDSVFERPEMPVTP